MTWFTYVAAAVLLCLSANSAAAAEPYPLVWADEFDVDGPPNRQNWIHESGFVRNEELQWYQPANARCEGGSLLIEAKHERVVNTRYKPGSADWHRARQFAEYTSASIQTRGRKRWLYGRFVMRGRIDTDAGLWPAFWTLGEARDWPGCGEIDIMEFYDGKLLANAAWLGHRRWMPKWDSHRRPIRDFKDSGWAAKFHEWRMDWDHDRIAIYVDDELLNEIDVEAAVNGDREQARPFREPHYLLLNLAVGGSQGGNPANTEFPARFEIDYVRVYQQPTMSVSQP